MRLPFLPARPKCQLVVETDWLRSRMDHYRAMLVFESTIVKWVTKKRFWVAATTGFYVSTSTSPAVHYFSSELQPVLYFNWPAPDAQQRE